MRIVLVRFDVVRDRDLIGFSDLEFVELGCFAMSLVLKYRRVTRMVNIFTQI